jgi:hypothetical protein
METEAVYQINTANSLEVGPTSGAISMEVREYTVDERRYTVIWVFSGRLTLCTVTTERDGRPPLGATGATVCHPKDAYDRRLGMKYSLRKACGIPRNQWWDTVFRENGPKLYRAFRLEQRQEQQALKLDGDTEIPPFLTR